MSAGGLLAYGYLRLSQEEAMAGESSSIVNQRQYITDYCARNGIRLLRTFADDGWSGGNFQRPGFQEMMAALEQGAANLVLTKDLSRLGRDMREASYYAETFFPEHGIRYIAIADNFDTEQENVMAPFQFAMNEVYLRDGSRKVKDVLRNKRTNGQYCACPPYGYKKDQTDKNRLVPDENTAPVVQRIFRQAAAGDSSRKIALDLNADRVIPPLKYRVLYRDNFSEQGAARASDQWNYTTVKRILKNTVYLGHTTLGKSRKVSFKSDKKVPVPRESWAVTLNTHEPLISASDFELAQRNLGKGSRDYRAYDKVRRSIFGGVAFCALCGHALCSSGTVYKGEREKYWYLSCTHQRRDIANPCPGVRIRYTDLVELVRQDLNSLICLTEEQTRSLVQSMVDRETAGSGLRAKKRQLDRARARLGVIDRMITKLYTDNAEGRLEDDRLSRMVGELEEEARALSRTVQALGSVDLAAEREEQYNRFFELARQYSEIDELTRETLLTFVDRIEVGPKIMAEGKKAGSRSNAPYTQSVRIFYKFIGALEEEADNEQPQEWLQN